LDYHRSGSQCDDLVTARGILTLETKGHGFSRFSFVSEKCSNAVFTFRSRLGCR
jgi:hypothetical protein